MIYRITTGDVAGKYVGNYAAGAATQFSDVPATAWYAGYVAYCADAGYLKGVGDGKYDPNGTLTGYQALAALLRAIGYNQNNDFTGTDWTVKVAEVAYTNGIMTGVYANLNGALTREQAAQLVFNALWTTKVSYSAAFGYSNLWQTTLVNGVFGITSAKAGVSGVETDDWGRPSTVWYAGSVKAVIIADQALNKYTTATSECLIALDMALKTSQAVDLWDNGTKNASGLYVELTDTALSVGGTGVLIEVYADRVVRIDTYLAQVGAAHAAQYDLNGHLTAAAYTDLYIYDQVGGAASTSTIAGVGYNYGEFVLVNKNTKNTVATADDYRVIVKAAPAVVGAQTWVYSDNSRTVAGAKYAAAAHFYKDATNKYVGSTNYTWYFDQYNNLIGAFNIATVYNYGVIENIQWVNPELSSGYALATIRYMNNTTANVKVASLNGSGLTYATTGSNVGYNGSKWVVSTSVAENKGVYFGTSLYAIEDLGNGSVAMTAVSLTSATTEGRVTDTVTTGVSKIGSVATDNATIYMVYNATNNTYAYYTGYTSVPTMNGNVQVDYVMASTGYAKYVYIVGNAASSTAYGLVQVKNVTWMYDNNTHNYTLTDAYVNGVLTPVVINESLAGANCVNVAANTVYYVTYTSGVVTGATPITSASWTNVGGNQYACLLTVDSVSGVDVVKTVDGGEWNVKNAAVYGEVKVGSQVVMVVTQDTFTASAIYVVVNP